MSKYILHLIEQIMITGKYNQVVLVQNINCKSPVLIFLKPICGSHIPFKFTFRNIQRISMLIFHQ